MKKESSYLLRMTSEQRLQLDRMYQSSGKKSLNEFILDRLFDTRSDQDKVLSELATLKEMISTVQSDIRKKPYTVNISAEDNMISKRKKSLAAVAGFKALTQQRQEGYLRAVEDTDLGEEGYLTVLTRLKSDISSYLYRLGSVAESDITWTPRPAKDIASENGMLESELKVAARSGADWVRFKENQYWVAEVLVDTLR